MANIAAAPVERRDVAPGESRPAGTALPVGVSLLLIVLLSLGLWYGLWWMACALL